jgi:hypothetical protein
MGEGPMVTFCIRRKARGKVRSGGGRQSVEPPGHGRFQRWTGGGKFWQRGEERRGCSGCATVRLRAARVSSRRSGGESGGAILANETTKLEPIRLQQERGTTEGKGKEERMSNRGEGRSFLFGFFVFQPQERHAVELSSRASQDHFDEAAEGRGARVASALRNVGQILHR